jgi:hypothetical protein
MFGGNAVAAVFFGGNGVSIAPAIPVIPVAFFTTIARGTLFTAIARGLGFKSEVR